MHQTGIWRGALGSALVIAIVLVPLAVTQGDLFPLYQLQSQDLPVLFELLILLFALAVYAPRWRLPSRDLPTLPLLVIGITLVFLLGWGTYALMGNFPLSRDEHMVIFDMAVFDKRRVAAPLPPQWRAYAETLVPAFLLNDRSPDAVVSAYLPMNAVLRLAFSKVADPAFFNPVLVLIGGVALHNITRNLFGEDNRARWVTLLIYGLSAQMLVAAMTSYAMTAHMALNLVWLAAFLRGGRVGHGVAIATSFLAVGLHQPIFHPIFVAPFLLWRLRQREWSIVILYGISLAAILGWWLTYPRLVALDTGVPSSSGGANGVGSYDFFKMRILPLLVTRDPLTFPTMILNLLRFIAWQNLALVPLMLGAFPLAWRGSGLGGPLVWGIGGLILVMTVLLPFQGHGWGYRYLHPFLGSFALLGGLGYQRLAARFGQKADGMVILSSALTFFTSIPVLLINTYGFVSPHVALEHLIARQNGTFVLIDTDGFRSIDGHWGANAIDHVRNLPDLDNRPLRLSSRTLDAPMLREICRRGSIQIVTRTDMHRVGFSINSPERSPRFEALVASVTGRPCLLNAQRQS